MTAKSYQEKIHIVPFGNGRISVHNFTPIHSQEEQNRVKWEIMDMLYGVFIKYENPPETDFAITVELPEHGSKP